MPDREFLLDEEDKLLLTGELYSIIREGGPFDGASAADALQAPPRQPVEPIPAEALAMLRALDNLRWSGRLKGRKELVALRDALVGAHGFKPISYELQLLSDWVRTEAWTSYSGELSTGDRLSTRGGEDWRVLRVEELSNGTIVLVCQPFSEDWQLQQTPFSPPQ